MERVAQRPSDEQSPVGLLVNNAGFKFDAHLLIITIEAEENASGDVMVRAPMQNLPSGAECLRARGRGAIIKCFGCIRDWWDVVKRAQGVHSRIQ